MLTFVKSVLLCGSVRERMQEARWGRVSLTDYHRWTEAFLLTGRTHKRLQADDRYHRALQLLLGVGC